MLQWNSHNDSRTISQFTIHRIDNLWSTLYTHQKASRCTVFRKIWEYPPPSLLSYLILSSLLTHSNNIMYKITKKMKRESCMYFTAIWGRGLQQKKQSKKRVFLGWSSANLLPLPILPSIKTLKGHPLPYQHPLLLVRSRRKTTRQWEYSFTDST